ncbi:MAG: hypothetical protein IKN04_22315 [Clostridia bacterium]|nr:hypothetical protein [Clostridia bacterium]
MKVKFRQKEEAVREFTEIHYDPIGWQLHNHDARTIITTFQQVFEADFHIHCDEEGQEYTTTYNSIQDFLSMANLEANCIKEISCVIPTHGEDYVITIDFRDNTIYVSFQKHVEGDKLSLFDPVIHKISHSLSQKKRNGSYSFQQRVKYWEWDDSRPATIEYIFHPAYRVKHDITVLRAFDQRFYLGTIHTIVWDQERYPWRNFEGFGQYLEEAPKDTFGFYEYLDEIYFFITIDEVRYRVSVYLDDRLSLSLIKIEYETDHPHDFTLFMKDLERKITSRG